ncbi:hypothetical protein CEXT_239691 [Caerostris extrusa]|uniref:Uncharacterized protein n=1 Tax=Caerostris extrusa TaxID=172846 RepID=A0AAV4U5D0_CAEEX|nr:hypothetical protein CEXT_239691 [Caerostris extrusa]
MHLTSRNVSPLCKMSLLDSPKDCDTVVCEGNVSPLCKMSLLDSPKDCDTVVCEGVRKLNVKKQAETL